jgi:serine phosphatase RsbU (regulator of sigma subunit)
MPGFRQDRPLGLIASRLRIKSIGGQLALGLAATLVPCLAAGFYFTNQVVRSRVYTLTENRLQSEAELISYGLGEWGKGISNTVQALADTPSFRSVRVADIQSTLTALGVDGEERLWRYWSVSTPPRLLAYSGAISQKQKLQAEANQDSRDYFQAARRGYATYQVVLSKTTGAACLNVAEPVFSEHNTAAMPLKDVGAVIASGQLMRQPPHPDVVGVVVLCIPLDNLGADTGLLRLFKNDRLKSMVGDNNRDFLNDKKGFDSAVVLVSNSGQLLFPEVEWNVMKVPSVSDLAETSLPELLPVARRAMRGEEFFQTISGGDQRYFALTAEVDSAWSLVLLLNENKATSEIRVISHVQAIAGVCALALALLIIVLRSRSISRPISDAGLALQKLSTGDFEIQLSATTDDEMGGLLRNIQLAADRLKAYLQEVTSFAITQKQIDTAKAIQRDFLLSSLPADPVYEVEAFSRPALEIGADWYDMVDAGDFAVVVVADVCDKGVPSALYMSVFRSLIRSNILDHRDRLDASGAAEVIREAITQVNNYMASNQNASMMFATVFIAAINKVTGEASYVCAGHEAPAVLCSSGVEMLPGVSGPAIGLFEGASYTPHSVSLRPGDSLVIYSDGLIDARNPADEGWGVERLRRILDDAGSLNAADLMNSIISSVDEHMAGADQFDDLTVMVFRWLGA